MRLNLHDMKNGLENILLSESLILGWETKGTDTILYMEFFLTNLHNNFVDFDTKLEYGCYKIGKIIFVNTRNIEGLEIETLLPKWYKELGEYQEVFEINSFFLLDTKIEFISDEVIIALNFDDFIVNIENSAKFSLDI